jgi:hypothetical protein
MNRRLCIIPCGAAKVWDKHPDHGPTEAKDVYTDGFAKACQNYAKMFFTDWVILSAKYGFLRPDDIVNEGYNVSFIKPSAETISVPTLQQQVVQKELEKFDGIVVLGGKHYTERVVSAFGSGKNYVYPLSGCKGIGYMLERLVNATNAGHEIGNIFAESTDHKDVVREIKAMKLPKAEQKSVGSYKGKYEGLYQYFRQLDTTKAELSYEQVEKILGFKLPDSAYKYAAWWANDITHSHAKSWMLVDWETDGIDLGKTVNFVKVDD